MKAHRSAHEGKGGGAKAQAIGPSQDGQTTKIHAVTDCLRRPTILRLTPGDISDVGAANDLLDAAGPVRWFTADQGYDADALRQRLRNVGGRLVIPI